MNESQPGLSASETEKSAFRFSMFQQAQFILKELRETLRDRRTIITLLAMPFLLYPLLGLGFRFLALQQSLDRDQVPIYQVVLANQAEAQWLREVIRSVRNFDKPSPKLEILTPNDDSAFDLKTVVTESGADVGVRIKFDDVGGADSPNRRSASVTLFQNEGAPYGRDATDFLAAKLAEANIEIIRGWARDYDKNFYVPITQSREVLEPAEQVSSILGLLPLVLLLMTVTGGVYPAIDLTAGERERNTLETLMALPVPRFRLLIAKYVAVTTVTILTGIMNLIAMSVTLYTLQLDELLLGGKGFSIGLLAMLFLVLTVFALFYSAVLLLLTSSAKSFKEAQAYLIPLLLLSIAPGLVILTPGWSLTNITATLPLVNILLLSRDLLEGNLQPLPAIAAVVSTILYGFVALTLAAQTFGRDAVAIGSRGSWRGILQRPATPSALPSISSSLIALAALFPAYFFTSGLLSRGAEVSPTDRLVLSAAVTAALFVGLPSLFLWHQRINIWSGLQLKMPKLISLSAAFILGVSTWPLVFELVILAQNLGIQGIDTTQIENVDQLLEAWRSVPTFLMLLALGVVPGLCEEFFFRGYLFNGLRTHFKPLGTILFTAVAFGLFHVVLAGGAAPERLLPSTLMGLLLGWVRWRSGSLIPSVLLHVLHNSTLLLVVQSRGLLAQWNIGQSQQEHLPWSWLVASLIGFSIGIALIAFSKKMPLTKDDSSGSDEQ